MEVRAFEGPPIGTNAYVLLFPERSQALVVDAPGEALSFARETAAELQCTVEALLLTHGHFDHVIDLAAFHEDDIPVYGHMDDLPLIENPRSQLALLGADFAVRPGRIDHPVRHGEILNLVGEAIEIRHVPGHSAGSVMFFFGAHGVAFSGDAVFAGSVGRTDLPGGSFAVLARSIREQIYTLPPETVLYPGHGPSTLVSRERLSNPYVAAEA